MILFTSIHIYMRAEILCKPVLRASAGQRNDFVAHFVCVLQGQVAKTSETLDGDGFTAHDFHLAH